MWCPNKDQKTIFNSFEVKKGGICPSMIERIPHRPTLKLWIRVALSGDDCDRMQGARNGQAVNETTISFSIRWVLISYLGFVPICWLTSWLLIKLIDAFLWIRSKGKLHVMSASSLQGVVITIITYTL